MRKSIFSMTKAGVDMSGIIIDVVLERQYLFIVVVNRRFNSCDCHLRELCGKFKYCGNKI